MIRIIGLLAAGIIACAANGGGVVVVTVDSNGHVHAVSSFRVIATNGAQPSAPILIPLTDGPDDIPPGRTFVLVFDPSRSGALHVSVDALASDGKTIIASATGEGTLTPGADTTVAVRLPGATVEDMGADGSIADLTEPRDVAPADFVANDSLGGVDLLPASDLIPPPDSAIRDLALPDFATADVATPDLAVPDFATPDFAKPDLAVPDFAMPDLIHVPTCSDGIQNGDETDIDCGGSCSPCPLSKSCRDGQDCQSGTCSSQTCAPPSFGNLVTITTPGPGPIELADFNGDGKSDILVLSGIPAAFAAGTGNRSAPFGPVALIQLGRTLGPQDGTVTQLTTSGHYDAVGWDSGGLFEEFFGNGDGTFTLNRDNSIGPSSGSTIVFADFNGDHIIDVVVGSGPAITVYFGVGGGGFKTASGGTITALSTDASGLAAGDLDGDGKVDLVVALPQHNAFIPLMGTATPGKFSYGVEYAVGTSPRAIALGDFVIGAPLDVVTTNAGSDTVTLYRGDGAGAFAHVAEYAVGAGPTLMATGDFDKNGLTDVVVLNSQSNGFLSVLLNNGSTFQTARVARVPWTPGFVSARDLDGDGRADIVVGGAQTSAIAVLFSLL